MDIIEIIAQDVFDKVRSRFSNLEMGDQDGNVTTNPRDARFFDFDFTVEDNNLGRVSVSINDIGTLKVYYGQGITEDSDSVIKDMWYDFLKEMRFFAKRRMLRFDTRDIMKGNLNKDDFQYLAMNGPKESNMTESQYFGSSKTSYRTLENTKLIIRHSKAVEEGQPGARSRHISALFIENSDGERFKYPYNHLAGAKAMQRHVANGGRPYDAPGMAIIKMSESIGQLNMFKRHAQRAGFVNEATQAIVDASFRKLDQLRQECINLSKQTHYQTWLENFKPSEDVSLDEVTLADYKDKFTIRQFEEDLTSVFPLLHSIMQEAGTKDLEDLVGEAKDMDDGYCDACDRPADKCVCDDHKNEGFEEFEQWAENIDELGDPQVEENEDGMDNAEPPPRQGSIREIAEVVKSFYDRETGKFPKGETGVVTHIKKQFGDRAGALAERLVAQLTQQNVNPEEEQMVQQQFESMLRLAGLVKEGANKSEIPAYKRKEKGGDWKMTTKDLEDEKTKSPTSSAGLARKKKELGMSEESKPSAGMSKGEKSALVKKAKKGGDIGKPGKSFDKVAKAAGGGEKGKRIAAAAMWKNASK